jgi:acetolactate synthase-1/2/3 large subunit
MIDSVPVVCITGQVASAFLGTDAFQEADVIGMTTPISKWNYQITQAEEVSHILAKAFYVASHGRPGPVVIDITKDAQFAQCDFNFQPYQPSRPLYPTPYQDLSGINQAASAINASERPYMLVGQGVLLARAQDLVSELASKAAIPTASTLLGLSAMADDHPYYVGMLGMHGNYGPNLLTNQADLIIGVGMRFDDRVTGRLADYATQAKIIHIEIDPAEIGKNVPTDIPIVADARQAISQLLPLVEVRQHDRWLARFRDCLAQEQQQVINAEIRPDTGGLRMGEVIDVLAQQTQGQAVIVTDVGQHQMMAARYYKFQRPHSHISSGGLGTMGFALPAAIGAALAAPERQVVAVIGDGGLQMTIQELATVAQTGVPIKIMVLNNNFLGMVRQWQELFFAERYSFVEMQNPDFIKVSEGFGVPAFKVDERQQLASAMQRFLHSPGPCLMEVVVEKAVNVFPMIASGDTVDEVRLS